MNASKSAGFFASASAVEVFDTHWGTGLLAEKTVVAIGQPTRLALEERGVTVDVMPEEATVEASIRALAESYVGMALRQ